MSRSRVLSVLAVTSLAAALGSGCATEQKMLKTPRYTLSYPDYWKVEKVGEKDGEPTRVTIGKYSESVVTSPEGPSVANSFEASQADVDVRIYAWPAPTEAGDATAQAAQLMFKDPDLDMAKQAKMPDDRQECGADFKRKFKLLDADHETFDLASRPGHRSIVIGGASQGTLVGVVSRVPFEQDGGLYCHNLNNMRLQLQVLLDGIKVVPGATPAAAPGAPAAPGTGGGP